MQSLEPVFGKIDKYAFYLHTYSCVYIYAQNLTYTYMQSPELGFGEIGRKIAEIWNAKTPKEKEPVCSVFHYVSVCCSVLQCVAVNAKKPTGKEPVCRVLQ